MSLQTAWYKNSAWLYLLWPLALLFRVFAWWRRRYLEARQSRHFASTSASVPVIVVGNITVGGTGKTPLLMYLVSLLQEHGRTPGIISRGYGGRSSSYPLQVLPDSDPRLAGDEPVLMARKLHAMSGRNVEIWVDPKRTRARDAALAGGQCDILLSDDGLQHYALARQLEIVVMDAERGLGNGLCLPAGPLREPAGRLREVDFILLNGQAENRLAHGYPDKTFTMQLHADALVNLCSGERVTLAAVAEHEQLKNLLKPASLAEQFALAGIGNPQRFFRSLEQLAFHVQTRVFPDHFDYRPEHLEFAAGHLLLMTEKDAIKCERFAQPTWWFLSLVTHTGVAFEHTFLQRVQSFKS
ncbi:MAG: tetraacyldisaccharide 4'-kinase [Pseudomonadales bacterium]|nr:tetraacyldisaccharide 4'-kinase [Pseudomonadales bacterium]